MKFKTIFLFIVLAELVSLAAHFFPWLNAVGFFSIAILALILSIQRLEYGLYFVLAELILGSKGYLFDFNLISIRMALFLIVMSVWLAKALKDFKKLKTFKFWGLFGIAILLGLIVGFLRNNNFGDLFLDANGYFYAALILPFAWESRKEKDFAIVFFAATTWVAIETLFLVYFWTHGLNNYIAANLLPMYQWIRDTGVGEITWLEGNFVRVFFQSHIFNLMAFLVLLNLRKTNYFLLGLNASVVLAALSRSFWVGAIVGLIVLLIFALKNHYTKSYIKRFAISCVFGISLIVVAARFPFPRPSAMDLSFLEDRAKIQTEAAASSRWNLLPPLAKAALEHPIVGSGFGRNVTYISNDPRIREVSLTGKYATYAFEWGWVDLWLKIGIVGLLLYCVLIFWIMYHARFAICLAIILSLSAVHFFTPYLNHPLGIGILVLVSCLFVGKKLDYFLY